jgi:ribosome-associated heat shock protein Hsp15
MSRATPPNTEHDAADGRVRLDKWLWAARFFKTRALAADAIDAGRIKRNGERVKTSHIVRVGERFVVSRESFVWDITVKTITDKRGNGAAAALMYSETAQSIAERERELAVRKAAFQAGVFINHRPTKRDRRDLEKYFSQRDDD